MMSAADRALSALEAGEPLDDDQLAEATGTTAINYFDLKNPGV